MTWYSLDLTEPATAGAASDAADPSLEAIPGAIETSTASLAAISSRSKWKPGDLASGAGGIVEQRAALSDLLASGGQVVTIHPWTQGAGDTGNGVRSEPARGWLSPAQAVQALVDKLKDKLDPAKDESEELLLIMVSGSDYGSWARSLAAFNSVLPLGDLSLCQRRAEQLATLEADKRQRIAASHNPRWRRLNGQQHGTGAAIRTQLGALLARVETLSSDTDPLMDLQAFLDNRTAMLTERQRAWDDLRGTLGPTTQQLYVAAGGSPEGLAAQLQQSSPPNPGAPLCALVAVTGPAGCLSYFKEVVGQ
ncbi:hypothetical protein RE428_08000 [Marinobacter nanhaiticus D15-8W]|uniref:Uncharacterized protein n=1 Tax=Marinobacter nanhaiticus D15-8W TaxID=626887 RepID=N6X0J6_9GAMM|nr:hypothetical protein [Marinobacter nanhaiticus]ENO14578.1 hypothetical protein J057_04486 [Marinobacter nanhaiticus D15-8W]BES69737.1 hypothetical protein RE428_07550 [Marinobacter nanhaiticus D15-8W]BES69782.1 hypothetical protein RE428_08000 [Marinobacter nanhaiticus D15-8W]